MKFQRRVAALSLVVAMSIPALGTGIAAAADGDPAPDGGGIGFDEIGGILGWVLPILSPSPGPIPGSPGSTETPAPAPNQAPPANKPPSFPTMFAAANGRSYRAAQVVLPVNRGHGKGKEYFFGEDFDTACYDGPYFRRGLAKLEGVARMIEKSGREVVFTVAPNKTSVDTDVLKGVRLPHGACTRKGLERQIKVLDTFSGKHFVPLRPALAADERQIYWAGDTHWNYIGASIYTKQLASRLSPRVGQTLRFRPTKDARSGDMAMYLGQTPEEALEVNEGLEPRTKATITRAPGTAEIDPQVVTTTDYRWHTSPKKRSIGGRTLLLGDSFTYLSMRSLRPAFANGRFMWTGFHTAEDTVAGIMDSNTVVIEVVQRFTSRTVFIRPEFRQVLRRALAHDPKNLAKTKN